MNEFWTIGKDELTDRKLPQHGVTEECLRWAGEKEKFVTAFSQTPRKL